MKLILLLVVVLIAVFKANCRIYTDGPDGDLNPDFTDESQHLLSGSENPHTYDVDHQMKKDVNEENPIKLRGKADKNILKKLIKNLKSMEMDLQSIKENQENLKDVNTKLDSIIDANMDLQSIKEVQENITGKLDSLKYVNTKLDSIIDANMDLQSIKEIQENITGKLDSLKDVNSNQDTKLDSIIDANMDLQSINITGKLDSLKDVNSNQNTKLDSLVDVNSNQNTKLDSIIDAIGTIYEVTTTTTTPTTTVASTTRATTTTTIPVTTTTTTPTTTVASTTRATTTTTIPGCSSPWVSVDGGCYLFVRSNMNWTDARTNCRSQGGDLAIINSSAKRIALVDYMKSSQRRTYWWLGGSNLSGDWLYEDNSPVTDGWNVRYSEPDSGADACMWTTMYYLGSMEYDLLFDYPCSYRLYSICKK